MIFEEIGDGVDFFFYHDPYVVARAVFAYLGLEGTGNKNSIYGGCWRSAITSSIE